MYLVWDGSDGVKVDRGCAPVAHRLGFSRSDSPLPSDVLGICPATEATEAIGLPPTPFLLVEYPTIVSTIERSSRDSTRIYWSAALSAKASRYTCGNRFSHRVKIVDSFC